MVIKRLQTAVMAVLLSVTTVLGAGNSYAAAESTDAATDQKKADWVDFTQVKITDDFWAARQKQVICSILNTGIEKVEAKNGGFHNFVEARKKNNGESANAFEGDVYFLDSDAYKMIEAMSYGLQIDAGEDEEIQQAQEQIHVTLEKWIPEIVGAQEEDGYLDTFFTLERGTQSMSATTAELDKWTDFAAHELYVAGHFYEAAVALYRADGDTRLLDAAVKNADLVNSLFGENGTKKATSGHQEIELALIKLASACEEAEENGAEGDYTGHYGERSDTYIKLAKRFLDLRGDTQDRDGYYSFAANNASYRQDHQAVAEQESAVGHVVRAMYQYIAMTDVSINSDTDEYDKALTALWNDVTETKSYITGGMGTTGNNESFGASYELPLNGAYAETCGSIGSVMWNHRMNLLYGDSKYVDVLERTLYNAVISGVNFDGDKFFYQNPVSSDGSVERSAWFGCACCPPNLMRLINSLGSYIYTQSDDEVKVNLYIGNETAFNINNNKVAVSMESQMPWSGDVSLTVNPEKDTDFSLSLRMPEWADGSAELLVNNENVSYEVNDEGYIVLHRTWQAGDTVKITFAMEITRNYLPDQVTDGKGCTAITKGPVVYVAEAVDNDFNIDLFTLPQNADLKAVYTENIVGGTDTYGIKDGLIIQGTGNVQTLQGSKSAEIKLIPYYAWNNRGKGIMRTYLNENNELSCGLESFATASASYTSIWQSLSSINDGDNSTFWCSWIQGSVKLNPWVQYEFDEPVVLAGCTVNWFQDTAGVRVPSGITIQYWADGAWKDVEADGEYTTFSAAVDNDYKFTPVQTTKIRMTLNNKTIGSTTYALGINEWKLIKGTLTADNQNVTSNTNNTNTNNVETPAEETTAKTRTVAPGKVKGLKGKRNKKGVKISYKKVKKASGYIIYRSRYKKKGFKKIADTKKISYTDKKAKKKVYYYRVKAYKKVNGEKVYGKYSKTIKVKK